MSPFAYSSEHLFDFHQFLLPSATIIWENRRILQLLSKNSLICSYEKRLLPSPQTKTLTRFLFLPLFTKENFFLKIEIAQILVDSLSKPFRFALIDKFSHGRPSMERSRQIFSKLGLKASFSLGHLDPKRVQIRL